MSNDQLPSSPFVLDDLELEETELNYNHEASTWSDEDGEQLSHPPGTTQHLIEQSHRDAWKFARDEYFQDQGRVKPAIKGKRDPEYWIYHDYIHDGAIPQPADGPNAKTNPLTERCLTCIRQRRACTGNSIKEGKCECCQGLHSGRGRTVRRCVWVDPQNDLWTYPDAHNAAGGTKNPLNTKKALAERKQLRLRMTDQGTAQDEVLPMAEASPALETLPVTLIGFQSLSDELVQRRIPGYMPPIQHVNDIRNAIDVGMLWKAAYVVIREGILTSESNNNIQALFDAVANRNFMEGNADTFQDRIPQLRAQLRVLQVLRRMKEAGEGLNVEEVTNLADLHAEN